MSSPAAAGQNGTLGTKFPGRLYMKHIFTSGAPWGRDPQLTFEKQYILKKYYFKRELHHNFISFLSSAVCVLNFT